MAKEMAGGRELVAREAHRMSRVGQRVAGAGLLELGQGDDVAGAGLFDGLGLLALHEQDVAGALLLARALVEQLGVGGDLAREDAGQVHAAGELVVDGLEDEERRGRRRIAGQRRPRPSPLAPSRRLARAPCRAGEGTASSSSSSRSVPMFLVARHGDDRS